MSKQNIPETTQFLLYTTEDGKVMVETRLEADTVWLTQTQMAELFQSTQQNISLHIQNIFDEGELSAEATHKKYLSVRREGNRDVKRNLDYYNLDMIISVGYRVNSLRGTQFRIWARTHRVSRLHFLQTSSLSNQRRATRRVAPTMRAVMKVTENSLAVFENFKIRRHYDEENDRIRPLSVRGSATSRCYNRRSKQL